MHGSPAVLDVMNDIRWFVLVYFSLFDLISHIRKFIYTRRLFCLFAHSKQQRQKNLKIHSILIYGDPNIRLCTV